MKAPKVAANWIINDILGLLKKNKLNISQCPLAPEVVGFLARRVESGSLEKRKARELMIKWFNENLEDNDKKVN